MQLHAAPHACMQQQEPPGVQGWDAARAAGGWFLLAAGLSFLPSALRRRAGGGSNFHLLDYCTVHTGTVQEQVLYLRKKSRRGALNLEPPAVQQTSKTTRPAQPLIPLGVGVEVFCFNASTVQGGSKGCSRQLLPELGAGLL